MAASLLSACAAGGEDDPLEIAAGDAPAGGKADGSDGPLVELKVTVERDATAAARSTLRLRHERAERRWVHFYDTPELSLFGEGLILRARKVADGEDDSTVKVRPLVADDAPAEIAGADGFECETDWLLDRTVASCKLSADQGTGEIDEVAAGVRELEKLFSPEQEDFITWAAPDAPSLEELDDLGPVDVWVWRIRSRRLPAQVTAEHWVIDGAGELLEISMRVPETDAEDAMDALLGWLESRGIAVSDTQETKTRWVLEHFAAARR